MQHCKIKCSYFKALPVATPTLRDPTAIKLPLAVVDPQDGPPLFLDQTEAQRAEQIFFGDCPPPSQDDPLPPLSQSLDLALPGSLRIITIMP